MGLPESDQRGFVCADRECGPSRLSYDPARAPVERKDPWGIVRQSFTHRGTRASTWRRPAPSKSFRPRLSLCAPQQK